MSNEDNTESFLATLAEETHDYGFTLEVRGPEGKTEIFGTLRRLEHEPGKRWQAQTANHYGLSSDPGMACAMALLSSFERKPLKL